MSLSPLAGSLSVLGRSRGVAAFVPSDIAGLIGWESTYGLFQERTGASATTPATADTAPVGTWASKYGTATYITAGTDGARPPLRTNVLGALPVLRPNGSAHFMSIPYAALGTTYTIIAVYKSSATGFIFGQWSAAVGGRAINNLHVAGGNHRFNQKDDASSEVAGGTFDKAANDGAFHTVVCRRSGTAWLNRVDASDATVTATVGTTTLDTAGLFAGRGAVLKFNGDLAALYLVPSAISDAQVLQMESHINRVFYLANSLTLTSPAPYQVFQRSGATGSISIAGNVALGTHDIEASFNGGAYATIASAESGDFTGTLTGQAQGQGTLTVRIKDVPAVTATVSLVGIGDVFVIAGQSNASGRGQNSQVYSHATLKAGLFGNDYVWKELADITDSITNQVDTVSLDGGPGGSMYPLIATAYLASRGVPVAFIPCAKGGTDIVSWLPGANHQNRATLYGSMVYRALGTGCKTIIWWQGEADVVTGMSQATYNGHLDTIANAVQADLGVKLMACKLLDMSATPPSGYDESTINAAIAEAWGDNANVLTGPDFSDITPSVDGLHLITDGEIATGASRWWTALQAAFGW